MFYQIQGFELFYRVLSAFWQAQREQYREQSVARFMYARGVTEIYFPGQLEEEQLFLHLAHRLQVPVHATPEPVVFHKEFL